MSEIMGGIRETPARTLTEAQKRALFCIDLFSYHKSEWRSGDKPARGGPMNWDRIRLTGKEGSIVIMDDDWRVLQAFLEPAPFGSSRIYQLSEKGRASLADATPKIPPQKEQQHEP